MRERRWLLLTLYGILLAVATAGALKATRPKFKIATTSTTTSSTSSPSTTTKDPDDKSSDDDTVESTTTSDVNATTGHTLTGIPQIDYIWDPNLPRELNGYNLSDYPFYNSIPEDIDFKCDGLHDGFYASVPHKCQVYHHCLYGTRYDFLCANFTAFDQKTFICHFVSEVDCANSKKYWHRNDALYKATTSSTSTTSTTPRPTTSTTTTAPAVDHETSRDRDTPRRRRPLHRWRPSYDYYDEEYYDEEYERGRLYGYDRRIYDDYDDRKYRRDRDRDRDFPERSFRDRTERPPRAERDRDREITPRDRFPMRTASRRDPMRSGRDPLDDDRPRLRDQDQGTRLRDIEDSNFDDRRPMDRSRDGEDRRYSDGKRFRDDYDDKELPVSSTSNNGNTDGLVKPAAPVASVYSRPRTPPKIRRPVPLSEQDRYAYKTSSPPPTLEEPRRRPIDLLEDDYYDDDFEDVRPRRPLRPRRPNYRDRDRDLYDIRDRDRPYRTRYRDEDDVRLRKHPERPRDRYYDRDRNYDRSRDRGMKDRERDRTLGRSQQDSEKPERPYRPSDRDRMLHNTYDHRTTEKPREPSTTLEPKDSHPEEPPFRSERPSFRPNNPRVEPQYSSNSANEEENQSTVKDLPEKFWRPTIPPRYHEKESFKTTEIPVEEYLSEYYDESEEPLSPPTSSHPRTAIRVVKRPFLPSRGGNPNPRGLSPVGTKAASSGRQDDGRSIVHENTQVSNTTPESKNYNDATFKNLESYKEKSEEDKRIYDAYKVIQSDLQQKRISDNTNPSTTISSIHVSSGGSTGLQDQKPIPNWTLEEPIRQEVPASSGTLARPNNQRLSSGESSTQNPYNIGSYKDDDAVNGATGPASLRAKQRLNEVVTPHRLQDIPESEYDVTLNDALTPTLNHQETSLPSGFVLPLHRQSTGRDTLLQPSENDYEYSRPLSQLQQQQQQQQKPFVPSPRFVPPSINRNERPKTVYYRTPETIHVAATAPQYRQQRGPWQDYSSFR